MLHAWGMTEMNPLGTIARVKRTSARRRGELALRATQGYALPFVETRHNDDDGARPPARRRDDGRARGPRAVGRGVVHGRRGHRRWTADGWFKTGDVVTIDAEGYVRISDRSKDVIKSGGEWISSVDLENAMMSHPAVLEAAVFAGKHPKWAERPSPPSSSRRAGARRRGDSRRTSRGSFAKCWLPDAYVFVEQIPRTSTGKFLKTRLRETYGDLLMTRG